MKILKIIAGIVLLVLIAIFLIGMISPEVGYDNQIVVNRPVKQVWNAFTDAENLDQWLEGMQAIEPIDGEPLTAGSKFKLVFVEGGERMEITEEVTIVEENKRFAFNVQSLPLTSRVDLLFISIDSNTTRIQAHTVAEGNGILWKPIIRFSGSMMQEQSQKSYENLKSLIEVQPDTLVMQ